MKPILAVTDQCFAGWHQTRELLGEFDANCATRWAHFT